MSTERGPVFLHLACQGGGLPAVDYATDLRCDGMTTAVRTVTGQSVGISYLVQTEKKTGRARETVKRSALQRISNTSQRSFDTSTSRDADSSAYGKISSAWSTVRFECQQLSVPDEVCPPCSCFAQRAKYNCRGLCQPQLQNANQTTTVA